MRNRLIILLSVIALAAAVPMLAQVTAQLAGQATSDGAPLPGVTVTITSPNLQGTRTAITDSNGRYVFAALPPGSYTAVFELTGMQTVTKKATLALNTSNKVDAAMTLSSIAEAITVTAAAPAVMETSQVASNFAQSEIEALPVARNVLAVALLAPGVNDNTASGSQLQISGSPGYDNLVMVNGVPITENVRSQAMTLYIEDAIQETTVLTGSVSAEWGRFTGGVVNSITKSGGNEFSGSLRANLDNPSWSDERPGEVINIDTINKTYQATLGGFILKDRLWFFLAGHDAETSAAVQTYRLNIPLSRDSTTERWEYKLTGQITPKHSLVGSYFTSDRATTNTWFSTVYDQASVYDRTDPEELLSAHYNGMITSNLLLEGHYSQRAWEVSVGGGSAYTDVIKGTLALNRADANARFNSPTFCGVCDTETRDNEGYTLKSNYYLTTGSLGTHNIVGGYETFNEMRHANNYQSGSNFRIYFTNVIRQPGSQVPLTNANGDLFPVTGTNTYIRWTPIFSISNTDNNMSTDSLFVNDRWDFNNRWSFNVGLRYDKNDAVDADGNVASDDAAISPRLTAIFDPLANGKHRVTAAYNRYVSRVLEGPGTAMEMSGSPATIDFNYRGPSINTGSPSDPLTTAQALQIMFDWFNAQCKESDPSKCGTSNTDLYRGSPSIPGLSTIFQETLKSPSVDEFVLGYGTQFSNAYMKVDLIHREWTDFFSYRTDQTTPRATDANGATIDIAVAENTDLAERTYDGLQFQSAWRPMQRINIGVNYTWAKLKGNDEQESSTSGTVGNSPGAIYYPEFMNYPNEQPSGYLSYDQRHRVRAWVGYDVPVPEVVGTLNVSLLQNFDSGTPYSAIGTIDLEYDGAPDPASTNYGGPPVEGTYFFSERGAYRRPDVTRTDLALNYARSLFRNLELFAEGELLNVFGEEEFIANNSTVYTAYNGQTNCPGCVTFNPFTDTPVEGVHWVKGPNFGKPTSAASYQTAKTYRFSLGLRF
jgi:outer membrane receptor for ferrienterochelin and colicin